ncbi:hypothetical protein Hanom_Chr00s000006g01614261 [Helianthus anomalus]
MVSRANVYEAVPSSGPFHNVSTPSFFFIYFWALNPIHIFVHLFYLMVFRAHVCGFVNKN